MTRSAPTCPMESALAHAAHESRSRNCEMHVLQGADGSYRLADAEAGIAPGEILFAMVGAEGETLLCR